jgi:uncharacterized protein
MKLAVGPKHAKELDGKEVKFSDWAAILSEIIVGDAFGVDRMDYLLRDSHHAGVAYGRFDHYRLIDTLRILPASPSGDQRGSEEPSLGVEQGGIQSAEALMLARYLMYSQVYFHHIRRIYDIHLKYFLKEWLPSGFFSTNLATHLASTDNEITAALMNSAFDVSKPGYEHARRIVRREHYKLIYERNPPDVAINPEAGKAVFKALSAKFGERHFRHDRYAQAGGAPDFPVRRRDDRINSSLAISETLKNLPVVSIDYVFADRSINEEAEKWLNSERQAIIKPKGEGVRNG